MSARVVVTAIVMLTIGAPVWAAGRGDLEIFQDVSRQVLRYPQFTVLTVSMHRWRKASSRSAAR